MRPDHQRSRSIWLTALDQLLDVGLTVCVNWPFAARGRPLTGRAVRAGIPAVQVELSYELFVEPERIEVIAVCIADAAMAALRDGRPKPPAAGNTG